LPDLPSEASHPLRPGTGTGQASAHIQRPKTWRGLVFLVNSRTSRFPASSHRGRRPPQEDLLLANVRSDFAEFLTWLSFETWVDGYQSTSVGLCHGPWRRCFEARSLLRPSPRGRNPERLPASRAPFPIRCAVGLSLRVRFSVTWTSGLVDLLSTIVTTSCQHSRT